MNTFKYLIFLVNLIFFGLGIYLFQSTYKQLGDSVFNIDDALKSPIYFTLAISVIIIVISFIGFCGVCSENSCMIKSYASLILVCVILQAIAVYMIYKADPSAVSSALKKNLIKNFSNQSTSVQKSIQLIQQENSCCGVDGAQDYDSNISLNKIPDSCCGKFEENDSNIQIGHCSKNALYSTGCQQKITDLITENHKTIYIIVGCIFGFQILTVLLSCLLSKNIREQYNVV